MTTRAAAVFQSLIVIGVVAWMLYAAGSWVVGQLVDVSGPYQRIVSAVSGGK